MIVHTFTIPKEGYLNFLASVAGEFGGATAYEAIGFWKEKPDETAVEQVMVVFVATNESSLLFDRVKVHLQHLGEQSMYWQVGSEARIINLV